MEYLFLAEMTSESYNLLNSYYCSERLFGTYSDIYKTFTATGYNHDSANAGSGGYGSLHLAVFGFKSKEDANSAIISNPVYSGSHTNCLTTRYSNPLIFPGSGHDAIVRKDRYGKTFWLNTYENSTEFTASKGDFGRLFKPSCNGTYTVKVTFKNHIVVLKFILALQ